MFVGKIASGREREGDYLFAKVMLVKTDHHNSLYIITALNFIVGYLSHLHQSHFSTLSHTNKNNKRTLPACVRSL